MDVGEGVAMMIGGMLLAYLVYALLRPERF